MKKRIMPLMAGMLLLLTACGQTGDSSPSTMLPVTAVQSATAAIAPVGDKVQENAESLLVGEDTEEAEPAGDEETPKPTKDAATPSGKTEETLSTPAGEEQPDVPEQPAEREATYVDNDAESTLPPDPEKKPKKKRRAVTIGIVTALVDLQGAAAWFLLSYYFVRADALRVVRCTTEELTVALESGDKAADFRLTCSDMYGNSYPATAADGQYVFTGLS